MIFTKNKLTIMLRCLCALVLLLSTSLTLVCNVGMHCDEEVTIVGGGMAGALHAYHLYREMLQQGTKIRVIICEKNHSSADTTTANIAPSFTPDEILSVVPFGKALVEKLRSPFNEGGGIRVDDVVGVNDSPAAADFIQQAAVYSQDIAGYQERTKTLLALGKMSMDLWQAMYNEADDELKAILIASNFNACYESCAQGSKSLHNGYRIDLIYNIPNAVNRANNMKSDYQSLGYEQCALLSPIEVMTIDPYLIDFCNDHASYNTTTGILEWHNDSVALWRPGGCLDAKVFLPRMYEYLRRAMGTYVDDCGTAQDCFQVFYDKEVVGVDFGVRGGKVVITGLSFGDGSMKYNDDTCNVSSYVFCPGEAVGTLNRLGFKEPAYAAFAGASLLCTIQIPDDIAADYSTFNHCMEVHQEGVVLAWQARFVDGKIFIGVAGTKAFYGDKRPNKDQAFAKNRNLLQLNMINDVLPEFISWALGRDTKGQNLSQADLDFLENNGIVKRWAGVRAVAYDGFPTLGFAYNTDGVKVENATITTHLGSGGASFGPAAVAVSCSAHNEDGMRNPLVAVVLDFAQSNRFVE